MNVLNVIRYKKVNSDKARVQAEMGKLTEMLILNHIHQLNAAKVREYYEAKGQEPRLVIFEDTEDEIIFKSLEQLQWHIARAKLLLNVEKLAV